MADGLALAELDNVGDLPPAERITTVVLRASGELTVNGESSDQGALGASIRATGDAPEAGFARDHDVLSVLDESVAGVFHTARPADGGAPGAIALFLPCDRGVLRDDQRARPRPSVALRARDGGWNSDPRGVGVLLRGLADVAPLRLPLSPRGTRRE